MTDDPRTGLRDGVNAAPRGRWIWIASAVATAAVVIAMLAVGTHLPAPRKVMHIGIGGPWTNTFIQTVTFRQPATAIDVHNYGGPVVVSAGGAGEAGQIQVTETVNYNGNRPLIQQSVARRQLTLADPACDGSQCSAGFHITVPAGTAARVETDGGPINVSGLARPVAADSGGGPVTVSSVTGGLNAQTAGGTLRITGVSGTLTADTGGGPADAGGLAATNVTLTTSGGPVMLAFARLPAHVEADSGGGPVTVQVPGGSYAVSASSGGGPQQIAVATDAASPDTIRVSSDGGPISIR